MPQLILQKTFVPLCPTFAAPSLHPEIFSDDNLEDSLAKGARPPGVIFAKWGFVGDVGVSTYGGSIFLRSRLSTSFLVSRFAFGVEDPTEIVNDVLNAWRQICDRIRDLGNSLATMLLASH